jgi:hypothetical protein
MSYSKVSPLAATPQPKLFTDTSEMNTAGKSRMRSVSVGGGSASGFATGNPYAALQGIAEGEEEGSGLSPTSPGGSASQNSGLGGAVAFTSPPRGTVTGTSRAAPQQVSGRLTSLQPNTDFDLGPVYSSSSRHRHGVSAYPSRSFCGSAPRIQRWSDDAVA